MSGVSADGEVNHWPAFVDVLTTVIMVVTFMLVIMSAAVMMLSQRAIRKAEAQFLAKQAGLAVSGNAASPASPDARVAAKSRKAQGGVSALGDVVKSTAPIAGHEAVSILTRETGDTLAIKVKSIEAAQGTKGVEVRTSDTLLKVSFEPEAMRYDDENQAKVLAFLKGKAAPGAVYEVWSFVPQTGSISTMQRLAFYRAAITRNLLIKAGIAPGAIRTEIRVTDPGAPDGHMVRVVVKP